MTAIPSIPLSLLLATLISSSGGDRTPPSLTLFTIPVFFSKTKMSFGPINAMLVGELSPVATVCT